MHFMIKSLLVKGCERKTKKSLRDGWINKWMNGWVGGREQNPVEELLTAIKNTVHFVYFGRCKSQIILALKSIVLF